MRSARLSSLPDSSASPLSRLVRFAKRNLAGHHSGTFKLRNKTPPANPARACAGRSPAEYLAHRPELAEVEYAMSECRAMQHRDVKRSPPRQIEARPEILDQQKPTFATVPPKSLILETRS